MGFSSILASLQNPSSYFHRHRHCPPSSLPLLHRLHLLLPPCLSLPWLLHSISLPLFAFSSVSSLLPSLPRPPSKSFLQSSLLDCLALLDACNGLKEVTSDLLHYSMLVQYAVRSSDLSQTLDEVTVTRARDAFSQCVEFLNARSEDVERNGHDRSKLETCSSLLRRMGQELGVSRAVDPSEGGDLFDEMYAAKVTTIFVCGVLAAALSVKPTRSLAALPVPDHPEWCASLIKLQQTVQVAVEERKKDGAVAILQDLDKVHTTVQQLCRALNSVLEARSANPLSTEKDNISLWFQSLSKSSEDLHQNLFLLQQKIDELFRLIVSVRVGFVDALCHCET